MANAALYEGHELIDRTPPQELAALDAYRRGVQITRHVDDVNLGGDALRAVALATTCHSPDMAAVEACHAALVHLYDNRHWYRLWQTMDSVALVLASNGRGERCVDRCSATSKRIILRASGARSDLGFRRRSASARRIASPGAGQWMKRGADDGSPRSRRSRPRGPPQRPCVTSSLPVTVSHAPLAAVEGPMVADDYPGQGLSREQVFD